MSVIVYTESVNGKIKKASVEAVYFASKIAAQMNTSVVALCIGDASQEELQSLGNVGASKALKFSDSRLTTTDSKALAKVVDAAVNQENAAVVVFSHDLVSKAIASRLSAKYKAGIVSGVTAIPTVEGNSFVIKKPVFSGKAFADYEISTAKKIITLSPNSFAPEKTDATAVVSDFSFQLSDSDFTIRVKELKKESSDEIPLPEAELVVSAGRGLKGPENWGIVENLAKALGASTACSRPVADIGWRPHHEHVGQTGLAIRPNLYIAAGISGAIQHLAGVNQSKTIVVINTDKEAPFFKAADYGVVGDAFEILPKLTDAVKKFKAGQN